MEGTHASRPDQRHRHPVQSTSAPSEQPQPTWRPDTPPSAFSPEDLLQLQHTVGNQRVSRLLMRSAVSQEHGHRGDVPAPTPVARHTFAPPPARLIQRVLIDKEVQAALSEEEVKFFQAGPDVAAAEAKLQALMTTRNPPIKFELGLIYAGQTLKRVLKGTAPTGMAGTTSDNAQVNISSAAVAEALGIPAPTSPGAEAESFKEVVVTHNHPGGAPLSRSDVAMAVGKGMREIRAVGKFGVFAFSRRQGTWGQLDVEKVFAAYAQGEAEWSAACPPTNAGLRPLAAGPEIGTTFKLDNFLAKHFACKKLATTFANSVIYSYPDETVLINARKLMYPLPAVEQSQSAAANNASSIGYAAFGGVVKQGTPLPGNKFAPTDI